MRKRVAVIGGGASGAALLWATTGQAPPAETTELTLFHDEAEIGGHSRTIPVWFDDRGVGHVGRPPNAVSYPVDIGVQFVCRTLYPNLYRQLELPDFRHAGLTRHPRLRMSTAFGEDLNWGNFPAYQSGPRFQRIYDAETRAHARRFERDLQRAPLLRIGGRRAVELTVGSYLRARGFPFDGNFVRYLLLPYLSVINGYGSVDLLETTLLDLYPIFARIPLWQSTDDGPYGSFTETGLGWDRFTDGATAWVRAMCDLALERGARVRTSTPVHRVWRRGNEWVVDWTDRVVEGRDVSPVPPRGPVHQEAFDEIVLTTDMTVNRSLLAHEANPFWDRQRGYLAADRFRLLPGVCYIHQDENVLAPSLRDQLEDGQFTGSYAWGQRDEAGDHHALPYGLGAAFQTYMMHNIMGTPAPCYVSMYAEDEQAKTPDPARTIHVRRWRHGRWVASFFRQAKRELHAVQGLGGVWFAGNNTTVDSEEGALLSAMIVAERMADFRYPFPRLSAAHMFYAQFRGDMFPASSPVERVRRMFA